ncbi:hypothetical protein AB6889_12335 [Carnobacterium maltaromaticum]|uniref:hypothetical protein n=1 Tax=Carnobacterium maltaromaticum TaxID=2751 RepID=UPI0039BE9590
MNEEKIELPESNTKNRFDELLEKFEISKSEMTKEELQGFAKSVLKYASSNEEANKYIDQLLADILEKEEGKSKFEVGEHYYSREIVFKILRVKMDKKYMDVKYYNPRWSRIEFGTRFRAEWDFAKEARKATDEEIKLFKRAEMYHKHGRKLDDLRFDDFVKSGNDIYQITQTKGFVESIIDGKHELYLTLEEAQEAHKKIVGE